MSQFAFLQHEWPAIFESAAKAENAVHADPRTACFYARRTLELAVNWAYKYDSALKLPYQDNLSTLIHEPSFKQLAGEAVFNKARLIVKLGNGAAHDPRAVVVEEAKVALRELFHFAYWFARSYARAGAPPVPGLAFNADALPKQVSAGAGVGPKQSLETVQRLDAQLRASDEALKALAGEKRALDEELVRLRAEIAAHKQALAAQQDAHDYREAETRDYFIDRLLKETGWALDQPRDVEFEVSGMPNGAGKGFVDYVLWGDDGKPLALVEAKRTRHDPRVGQQQAKLYADCLERQFGQRPLIFLSNGYEHWLWDDARYPMRQVQGFYKKAELELAIQRRTTRKPLAEVAISPVIVERYYQKRAITRVCESFERDHERKALLVMATGAGKTRTVIALCDLLMRANWVKRVLFLADRVALVKQAVNAFKKFLPEASPVNLVTEKEAEGRVFVSTYPTMMGLIDDTRDGLRRFGVGHFDLVVIDEAHRSVFQKYGAIFRYFDAMLVGLTATPQEDINRNTYRLFDLDVGVPTDAYSLEEAIRDEFLVPFRGVSVPLKFQREGIKYEDLSDEEKEQWDAQEWPGEGESPDRVEAEAVNKWLFNKDTVDKVLAHLMDNGLKVAGGDRLGKTILFAKNQHHAEFIAERFDANYPHYRSEFARIITFKQKYAQTLIDDFSIKEKAPHLAISVDMLDTGIDVPEVVNLVFFKLVRSKTKFWQMVGRGTRLCPDLFAPDQHKKFFYIFDYCQNLEFFSVNPPMAEGALAESLSKRLFKARLEMIVELDKRGATADGLGIREHGAGYDQLKGDLKTEHEVRRAITAQLYAETVAMDVDSFVVRPKRRFVEAYAKPEAWQRLTADAVLELSQEVAGLPTGLEPEREEAKRFDLLMLNLQLAQLREEPAFVRLREQVKQIAGVLEESAGVPQVRDQLPLILDVQTEAWWEDVTIPMLESLRRRLRELMHLIKKGERKPLYTDFEDELGEGVEIELPGVAASNDFAKFRVKALAFLRAHLDHIAVYKLRSNRALTATDLAELERMLIESGIGAADDIRRAAEEAQGLGLFVRSLVGLDRGAAKEALAGFLVGKSLRANQIEFVNLIVDHLTEHGAMDAARLYESPFTDLTPQGPEELFDQAQLDELIRAVEAVRLSARAAQ